MTIIEYVTEEVERQGHNTETLDGIQRVGWMLNAWAHALLHKNKPPQLYQVIWLAGLIEPELNKEGLRSCNVRVGVHRCPPPDEVPGLLYALLDTLKSDQLSPIEFYKEFERIHPFRDGNGRTGKILLNWLNGTLLNPIFPPNDLFGKWIVNP